MAADTAAGRAAVAARQAEADKTHRERMYDLVEQLDDQGFGVGYIAERTGFSRRDVEEMTAKTPVGSREQSYTAPSRVAPTPELPRERVVEARCSRGLGCTRPPDPARADRLCAVHGEGRDARDREEQAREAAKAAAKPRPAPAPKPAPPRPAPAPPKPAPKPAPPKPPAPRPAPRPALAVVRDEPEGEKTRTYRCPDGGGHDWTGPWTKGRTTRRCEQHIADAHDADRAAARAAHAARQAEAEGVEVGQSRYRCPHGEGHTWVGQTMQGTRHRRCADHPAPQPASKGARVFHIGGAMLRLGAYGDLPPAAQAEFEKVTAAFARLEAESAGMTRT